MKKERIENGQDWVDEKELSDEEDVEIIEYDLTASPNDFNVKTIFDFIESGAVIIPEFQRNYVWDIKRASRLIESIILNLPIPQIFLYEAGRNKFKVIDGQQRLMTIYYFNKKRFPINERRPDLRKIFGEFGKIPEEILSDDTYFIDFNLKLQDETGEVISKLHDLNYTTLKDYKTSFDLRPIRNVIIKQNRPENDDSSVYEIFKRLNTGGINLTSQEIRASIYHSNFYDMLHRINLNKTWRGFVGLTSPDLHLKDIEILLRSFALLVKGDDYAPSMTRFLNRFSKEYKEASKAHIEYLEKLFNSFMENCAELNNKIFFGGQGKFSISIFEAVFYATCCKHLKNKTMVSAQVDSKKINKLKKDKKFFDASQARVSSKQNVDIRLSRAQAILL